MRIAEGESLRSVCKDADMPVAATVCRWLALREDFRTKYARAHDWQAEWIAELSQFGCRSPQLFGQNIFLCRMAVEK